MKPNDFDLKQASKIYGIANTPPFLVRKLQDDVVVREISEKCSAQEILDALRLSVGMDPMKEPMTPIEAVRPYAYLVALWFKPEAEHLQEAARIAAPSYRWFETIADMLLQTFSHIQTQSFDVPGLIQTPGISMDTSTPTTVEPTIVIAYR